MEIDNTKLMAGIGNMLMSAITAPLRGFKSMFSGFGQQAADLGIGDAADESNPINTAIKAISDMIDNLLKGIGGAISPKAAEAAEAIETNFNASSAIFTEANTALGLNNATEIQNLFKGFVEDFLKDGIPALEANNGQRGTKAALVELFDNVTAKYTIALAEKYPNASEENIEKAARQLAGSMIGYDNIPDTQNTDILISRLPAPRAGSLAALVLNGQLNAHTDANVALTRITNNASALNAVKALVTGTGATPEGEEVDPFTAKVREHYAKVIADRLSLNAAFDTITRDQKVDFNEVIAGLRSKGIDSVEEIDRIQTFEQFNNLMGVPRTPAAPREPS